MSESRLELAQKVARRFSELPEVEAIALAGSFANRVSDIGSDIDMYVYSDQNPSLLDRRHIIEAMGRSVEIGNDFWGEGDEWIDQETGIRVDLIYFGKQWISEQIDRSLVDHQASTGYSTCFWHTVLISQALFDRSGWFSLLQQRSRQPYPDALQRAVIARNYPVLHVIHSSYQHQIENAVYRRDRVSINHRVAALLASYFDVIFAVNRIPHPGEKRLVDFAEERCVYLPENMRGQIDRLLDVVPDPSQDLLEDVRTLVQGITDLLSRLGYLDGVGVLQPVRTESPDR